MSDIDKTLQQAKQQGKLALIVMGANWCHDSRSLAKKLFLPKIKSVIDSNYELLFVDVGYLSKIREVITRFDQPVIYATPTVLIIDPKSERQLNAHNMHQWRDADKISPANTFQYFADIAESKNQLLADLETVDNSPTPQLLRMNQSIAEFEKRHAERIYKAFTVIGPLLKEKKEGGKAEKFLQYWKAVASLRYKITDDLTALRKQAIEIADASRAGVSRSEVALTFPNYPAFEWE